MLPRTTDLLSISILSMSFTSHTHTTPTFPWYVTIHNSAIRSLISLIFVWWYFNSASSIARTYFSRSFSTPVRIRLFVRATTYFFSMSS